MSTVEKSPVREVYKVERRPCDYRSRWRESWQEKRATRTCKAPDCRKEFQAKTYEIKHGRGSFCSRSCASRFHNTRFDIPIQKQNIDDHYGILRFGAKLHTNERPIQETDEYQDGYFGLRYACDNYRGPAAFARYAISHIGEAVRKGWRRLGKAKNLKLIGSFGFYGPGHNIAPIEEVILRELRQALMEALETLPKKQKTRMVGFYFNGLTRVELAAIEGCDPSTVSQSIKVSLKTLAELLPQWREEEEAVLIEEQENAEWLCRMAAAFAMRAVA